MKRFIITISLGLLLPFSANANTSQVLVPIYHFFDAMREHNGDKMLEQVTDSVQLVRVEKDGKVKLSDLTKFASFVSQSKKHLDEKLYGIKVHQLDKLATVWAPFVFYLDEKLSHCGVNSFQLVKQGEHWKINYLIDEAYDGDCTEFIAQF